MKVRTNLPPIVHSFAVPSYETVTKCAPPRSTATASMGESCAFRMVHSHVPSCHTLTVPEGSVRSSPSAPSEPVMTRPPAAAAPQNTMPVCS